MRTVNISIKFNTKLTILDCPERSCKLRTNQSIIKKDTPKPNNARRIFLKKDTEFSTVLSPDISENVEINIPPPQIIQIVNIKNRIRGEFDLSLRKPPG